jgi:hypothetical protein
MARNASGRTSFSPARSCAAVHGTAMCPSDTDIDGMFAGFSGKAPPFDPVTRRIDSTLAGESLRHKGADYATRRRELPTLVWSVVPPGLDSPPPRIKPPKRSVAPPARQAAGPPEARPPRRCLQANAAATDFRLRSVEASRAAEVVPMHRVHCGEPRGVPLVVLSGRELSPIRDAWISRSLQQ